MTNPDARLTTDEAAAEFRRCYTQFAAAIAQANALLQSEGAESESFRQADRNATAVWQRLREIRELAAKRWLA